jgi:hypothetical protein
MTRDYTHYLVNLINEDPDYVVDVLGISSWELVHAFPKLVQKYLEDEYDVRPENPGILPATNEEGDYDGSSPEEGWSLSEEEADL